MRFVKYLTLCRWAADRWGRLPSTQTTRVDYHNKQQQDQTTKQQQKQQEQTTMCISSRNRGLYAVRHARIKQQNKHLKRTIKQQHYSSLVGGGPIYLKFDKQQAKQQEPTILPLRAKRAPLGAGVQHKQLSSSSNKQEGVLIPYTFPLYYNII